LRKKSREPPGGIQAISKAHKPGGDLGRAGEEAPPRTDSFALCLHVGVYLRIPPRRCSHHGARPQSITRNGLTVQLCGDMHVANFGIFASAERNLTFGINDFDEPFPALRSGT
jgi:hypothetical protein